MADGATEKRNILRPEPACVVLLHGLAETPLSMAALGLALRGQGYDVANEGYPSTLEPMETLLSDYIEPIVARYRDRPCVHFVTHSLGGVLLHAALSRHLPDNLGRVVMTAPGLHGSEALEVYRRNWFVRLLLGPAVSQSGTGGEGFASRLDGEARYPLGVIAGCVSLDPIANAFLPWPHDGKMSVSRTRIQGMKDHIVLMTPHDLTANDPTAIGQILHFLAHGRFFRIFRPRRERLMVEAPL